MNHLKAVYRDKSTKKVTEIYFEKLDKDGTILFTQDKQLAQVFNKFSQIKKVWIMLNTFKHPIFGKPLKIKVEECQL